MCIFALGKCSYFRKIRLWEVLRNPSGVRIDGSCSSIEMRQSTFSQASKGERERKEILTRAAEEDNKGEELSSKLGYGPAQGEQKPSRSTRKRSGARAPITQS